MRKNLKLIFVGIVFLLLPTFVLADSPGEKNEFFIDSSYDLNNRSQLTATLQKIGSKTYFYLDDDWWQSLDYSKKEAIEDTLRSLDQEFSLKIYPNLTMTFGEEWKPGIDKDDRITILIHPMKKEAGGYFNNGDEYPRIQNPFSNEREMVYLNSQHLNTDLAKGFLAHEFMHLITFNQKEKIQGVQEEVWLNEARAEIAPTLLGYDNEFEGSNLQRRVKAFIQNPSDSLIEWKGESTDYGVLNIFTQYLLDQYGLNILVDSLQAKEVGISSLNYALEKNGFKEDFSQIFTNWLISVSINDCQINPKYCYKNPNLKDLKVAPSLIYLPSGGESTLSVTYLTKEWSANFYKIIGGKGKLKLEFRGTPVVNFKVPYLVQDSQGKILINFLELSDSQKGEVSILDFGTKNISLTLLPSIQTKISGFSESEPFYSFSFSASTIEEKEAEGELIKKLLEQIEFLKNEIAKVQAEINAILTKKGTCTFSIDLYYGIMNNPEVKCLQEFLKSQGPEIYPEGLITGNFLSLTQAAVIRFQEKYASEILLPLGLEKGTGYFGPSTRVKINQILGF
jgi:peptidoglycan hydrolase-like protein with peptidoglycan-binding domain